jgi:hypothetical protein
VKEGQTVERGTSRERGNDKSEIKKRIAKELKMINVREKWKVKTFTIK